MIYFLCVYTHRCREVRLPPQPKRGPGYDTKLHPVVRLQFWSFEEWIVLLHYHYSLFFSDPEWEYLLVGQIGLIENH